eukprot:COSAG02_NODE_21848_length_773_cov_0.755193_1_plen_85_part_10
MCANRQPSHDYVYLQVCADDVSALTRLSLCAISMPLNHMRFLANLGDTTIQERVLQSRMAIEILGFGILSAGNWGVFAAAHTDLF